MVSRHGSNPFYRSASLRLMCCDIRKVRPLKRVLEGLDAWITGLTRNQTEARSDVRKVDADPQHGGIAKISPLADWSWDDVWRYIRERDVPYNQLYDQGYASIGCAPCTRPIGPGQDPRSGRWWWEKGVLKECGIHTGAPNGSARISTPDPPPSSPRQPKSTAATV